MKRISVLLMLSLIMAFLFTQPVFAYNLSGYTWSSADPLYYYYDNWPSSYTKTAFQAAASAWNNATDAISWSFNSSYDVYTDSTNNSNLTWDGYHHTYGSGSTITSADASLNEYYTDGYSSAKRRSVAAHEFGHCLGLNENNDAVIMQQATYWRYDVYGISTPQSDDINGVEAMY